MAKVQLCTSKDGIYSRVGGWIWIAIANFSSWKERKRRNTANIVSGTWKQSKASNFHAFLRPISLSLLYIFNVVWLGQVTLKLMINKGKIYTFYHHSRHHPGFAFYALGFWLLILWFDFPFHSLCFIPHPTVPCGPQDNF